MMTIGAFAERTRLSRKALRLYDRLGLLAPARTEPGNGYRYYSEDQIEPARLIGLLRRIDMPLDAIADALGGPPGRAATAVGRYWDGVESAMAERRALVAYIQDRLTGAPVRAYDVQTRAVPERTVAAVRRHVHARQADAFFEDAFARLHDAGTGLGGTAGLPFLVYHGEVSDDSDGPLELCRPVVTPTDHGHRPGDGDLELRREGAHDEAYIRLTLQEMGWPALAPAYDALAAWSSRNDRRPAGPPRHVLIADQRTAGPDTPVCDLTLALGPRPR